MTALELFDQLPEYPNQLRVTSRSGSEMLISLHPTPLQKRKRLRTERNYRVGFAALDTEFDKDAALRLLGSLEPFTLVGTERERIQADEMARKHI
jgi:hypothetical protein